MNKQKLRKIHLSPAACAVDIGDGSERGEYVDQDYIITRLGRPHRAVMIMYCCYPNDTGWPERSCNVFENTSGGCWDYPYDNYFPYHNSFLGGSSGEPFKSMKDIRKHGQDIILTLTIDPNVNDDVLRSIANDLRPYGKIFLRINHEATGNWFSFSKRCTYKQIADFFVRFNCILKESAPNVSVILCPGGIDEHNPGKLEKEDEFLNAIENTDIWSLDSYISLSWGWPKIIAEKNSYSYFRRDVNDVMTYFEESCKRFYELNHDISKPFYISEINADGDVTGPYEQAECIKEFYGLIKDKKPEWLNAIGIYQFRDRGRLGLEYENPSNSSTGIETPLLNVYRNIIEDPYFNPVIEYDNDISLPVKLRWTSSEDAQGIAINTEIKETPVFCELFFDKDDNSNYMIEFNGIWFYKSPECRFIDLMPSFFRNRFIKGKRYSIHFFAPPANGENDLSISDGLFNYYYEVSRVPEIRIRYSSLD